MAKVVPSLSSSGWLTEISEKADSLMAYYITSEYSQSYIFSGNIVSLPYHIQNYGNDPYALESNVKLALDGYFRRYFDNVDVSVTTTVPDESDPNRINLRINVIVYEGETKYSLGREIQAANNKVVKIFDLNNG